MAQGTPPWLGQGFVQKALRNGEGDESIEVINIFTKPATNKGDNYTSTMIRATVEISREKGGRKITEKRSIVVKVAPDEEKSRDLVEKAGLFRTEMSMMSDTLPKMNEVQGYVKPFNARGFYMQKGDPTVLVFEDLAPMGYRMADRQAGLDIEHCLLALRALARFHACSVRVVEKEPEQKKLYNLGMFNNINGPEMGTFFNSSVMNFGKEIASWPEFGPKCSEKVQEFSKNVYGKGAAICAFRENEFHVINHGDFWVNNMLFRYDDHGKVIDHIFVDFQLCVYGTPAIDLLYFLNTSTSQEVYENNMDLLLGEYIKTLSNTMHLVGCKTEPPTLEAIKKSMEERELYGMIAGITILPLILLDKSEAKSLDELLSEDGTMDNAYIYKGKLFREVMLKRFPKWQNMGLLDC
ncbi:uncharacterized protein LOC117168249 [Belonocnema kinseyi]|uniref:uncharacterized protein LOC117168249 n=1 Tax=Belonocnema kinseyi TaxID=2817044 RepID=UPI00143DE85F|nr:uncharacterized protein LOC117168249 [Belonocnema kinseyi]XP_033209641.1 uncharacterized protein LOC117168249 [Belonocnema kinseyi]